MDKRMLVYGFDVQSERFLKLIEIANNLGIETETVKYDDIDKKVGILMGVEVDDTEYNSSCDEIGEIEFLLFSDFEREVLGKFAFEIKQEGIIIPHKAVITPTSKNWSFRYLISHIKDEHKIVNKYNELGRLIKKAQEKFEKENNNNNNLKEEIDFALSIRELKDISEKDIDERYNRLSKVIFK
ncbi:DUF3783 domain-containing protein [Peptoniphilus mikwangii]|uniref:DUF3783 domain-containing protein n=1 Tax=Peptoniphilus mikwangii TaxID=1354300 RepID=UPI00040012FD|nr:DUF3783 domain-containing protein [Peptoniphilus mikwangii]